MTDAYTINISEILIILSDFLAFKKLDYCYTLPFRIRLLLNKELLERPIGVIGKPNKINITFMEL